MSNQRAAAIATIRIEEAQVRATEFRFAPGAETGWHRHVYDYVVVPLLDGSVTMEVEEGLQPEDKARGIILACQAKSAGNLVVDA